jgi:4-amino-4-deoxy-L-arabinose transferase-like glycosyltransferase
MKRDHTILAAIALAKVVFHFALTGRYGIFRDELYYLACARHLAWGYVDHPPLSIAVLAGVTTTLGDSLFAIRLLPVLAGAGVVFLSGLLVRELGGRRFAQVLTALAVLVAPNFLAMSTFFSMNAFEQLFWLLGIHVLVRLVKSEDPRWWIAFGAIAGLALMNKLGTSVFLLSLVLGLALTRQRRHFLSPWLYLGGAVALLIFLPHLLWEIRHDWPFVTFVRASREWAPSIPPLQFLSNQILTHHPINFPLWLAGTLYLFFARSMRPFRMLGVVFVGVFAVFMIQESKDYYVTPVYPIALAAGAIALERGLDAVSWGGWAKPAALSLLLLSGAVLAPAIMPILPPAVYERYVAFLGLAPPAYIAKDQTPLPQHLADRFGWEEMVRSLAEVYHALPEPERAHARILCGNWGEAGAVDHFGERYGLPRAISPLHSYWSWGPGEGPIGSFVVIGLGEREDLLEYFDEVEERSRARAPYAVENDEAIYVARGLKRPLAEVWGEIRRY